MHIKLSAFMFLAAVLAGQSTQPKRHSKPDHDKPGPSVTAIAAMPTTDNVADGVLVQVIDGITKQPLANASVFTLPIPKDSHATRRAVQAMQEQLTARRSNGLSVSNTDRDLARALHLGSRYRTDADGVAIMPRGASRRMIAMAGSRVGRTAHGPPAANDGAPWMIEVRERQFVDVRVLQWTGKPAPDVRIGAGTVGQSSFPSTWARSGRDGVCRVELTGNDRNSWGIAADIIAKSRVSTGFNPTRQLGETIELRLPQCGRVRFILYGDDNRPLASLQSATLSEFDTEGNRSTSWQSLATAEDGDSATWHYVGLGVKLRVTANVAEFDDPLLFEGDGPTRVGEFAILDGRIAAGPPIATLRLLDQAGSPIANELIGVVRYGKTRYRHSQQRTDEHGRITLPFQRKLEEKLYLLRRGGDDSTKQLGTACAELPMLKPGRNDLGDLRLQDEPLFATGKLVGESGQPVGGVWLTGKTTVTSGPIGGGSGTGYYLHRVKTDNQGRFELRELQPAAHPVRLRVEGSQSVGAEWASDEFVVQQGDRAKMHNIYRAGVIDFQFAGGSDLEGTSLDVAMTHHESGKKMHSTMQNGKLFMRGIRVGTYDFRLGSRHSFNIENISVRTPDEEPDPRARSDEWRKHFQLAEIAVTDPEAKPVAGVMVWCIEMNPDGTRSGGGGTATDKDGRARFLAPRCDLLIEIKEMGYNPIVITENYRQRNIQLQRIAPIEVRIKGLPVLPDGVHAELALSFGDGRVTTDNNAIVVDGKATLQPMTIGQTYVTLLLRPSDSSPAAAILNRELLKVLDGKSIQGQLVATGKAGQSEDLELEDDSVADLIDRIRNARELTREHKKL